MAAKRATIKDVARLAGVSVSTTSRVLSRAGRTSPAAEERVRAAAKELNYRFNLQASSLRSSRTRTIGLLISDVRNPFFAELAHAIEQAASAAGYVTLLGNANESVAQQDRFVQATRSMNVDGVILNPQGDGSGAIGNLIADGTPTVFVDRTVPGIDVPAVTSDPTVGVREAVEHLVACGHSRIGYIAGPQTSSTGRERLEVYREEVARWGLDPSEDFIFHGDYQQESGERGAEALLQRGAKALFASDSLMTLGAMVTCRRREARVGHDIDLVGFDDIAVFENTHPALTVVDQDVRRLGTDALALLLDVMRGEAPRSVRLPTSLTVRGSTRLRPSSPSPTPTPTPGGSISPPPPAPAPAPHPSTPDTTTHTKEVMS